MITMNTPMDENGNIPRHHIDYLLSIIDEIVTVDLGEYIESKKNQVVSNKKRKKIKKKSGKLVVTSLERVYSEVKELDERLDYIMSTDRL